MKKYLCTLIFAFLLAANVPAHASPNHDSLSQIITGWKSSSPALTQNQKSFLTTWVKNHQVKSATCEASFSKASSSTLASLTKSRATNVCKTIKSLGTGIRVEVKSVANKSKNSTPSIRVRLFLSDQSPAQESSPSPSLPANFGLVNEPLDTCKISSSGSEWNSVGFPITQRFGGRESYAPLKTKGEIKALVIGVDFPNYPGRSNLNTYLKSTLEKNNDFFKTMSYGAVSFQYTVLPNYVRMTRNAEDYGIGRWNTGDYVSYYREALNNAASKFDISGYDIAYVVGSPETPFQAITPGPAFPKAEQTQDGVVPLGTATGGMPANDSGDTFFRWMAHETGHLFGWVDLYDVSAQEDPIGGIHSNFGWWDIMSMNWETHNLEINGWFRFQLGWLQDSEIVCIDSSKLESAGLAIADLSSTKSSKLVVIRLASDRAIALERRGVGKYAPMIGGSSSSGILVYEINGAKSASRAPIRILRKSDYVAPSRSLFNIALKKDDELIHGNLTFKIEAQTSDTSFVKLTKR